MTGEEAKASKVFAAMGLAARKAKQRELEQLRKEVVELRAKLAKQEKDEGGSGGIP